MSSQVKEGISMSIFLRRRLVWLAVLMIWVGMVSAVVVYQATDGHMIYQYSDGEPLEEEVEVIEALATRMEEDIARDEDFFLEFRLERDRSRSQQLDLLRELVATPETERQIVEESQRRIIVVTERMEKEMEVESLIRARGYQDALAFIHGDSIDIIVLNPDLLKEDDVARIADTASRVTGFPYEEITILERPLNAKAPVYP